jgi:hypothetical protein
VSGLLRPNPGRNRRNSVRGLMLLAYGNPQGLIFFGSDTQAYLASLAPLVGFLLVYGAQAMMTESPRQGGAALLAGLISVIGPPVLAEPLCRRWGREREWGLYANVLNWAVILLVGVALLASCAALLLVAAGVSLNTAVGACALALLIYSVWLQWFTARCALDLTRWQTVKLLLLTQLGTTLLIAVPTVLAADLKL